MQIRDKKTLAVDTVFPILLVIIGLALATISIFKDGASRPMYPPAIYPTPIELMYNADAKHATAEDTKKFMQDSVIAADPKVFQFTCPQTRPSFDAQDWQSGIYGPESAQAECAPTIPIANASKIGLKQAVS